MENQIEQQEPTNKKKSFLNIFTIIAIIAVLAFVGYMIFGKKITPKSVNTGTATVSWNANTESDLAGYRIYYGTAPRTDKCPPGGYPGKIDVSKTDTPDNPTYTKTWKAGKHIIFLFQATTPQATKVAFLMK
jgi:hypothetical protein